MNSLEGRLNTKAEIAAFLRNAAKAMNSAIAQKSSAAAFRQWSNGKGGKRAFKLREQEIELENTQAALFTLSAAHETGDIVRHPHLEDIRNRKQVELINLYEDFSSVEELRTGLYNNRKLFDQLAVYSIHDWEKAFHQLQDLMNEFEKKGHTVNKTTNKELEKIAKEELKKMEEEEGSLNGGKSNKNQLDPNVIEIVPEIKLTFNPTIDIPQITIINSKVIYEFVKNLWEENTIEVQEQFFVLYVNRANKVIGYSRNFKGGITGTVADSRLIFATALKCLATGIVLIHNHPSGQLRPSDADIQLTRTVKEIGKLHSIVLMDHIIMTKDYYFSFVDEGIL
jgi:DNA repair protein RadC